MLSGDMCMLPMWKKMPIVDKKYSLPAKTPAKLKPPAAWVVPTGLNGKESETEFPWHLLYPPRPMGWSFIHQLMCLWPRSPPNAAWQSEKYMKWSLLQTRLWTCKRFPPQAVLQITKLCLQVDRDVYVFVAGCMCCVKGVSEFVFKPTGLSSGFQLRQVVPIALRATHELVGVKLTH